MRPPHLNGIMNSENPDVVSLEPEYSGRLNPGFVGGQLKLSGHELERILRVQLTDVV